MGTVRRRGVSVVARALPIAISLCCLAGLAADNPRICTGPVACRWPSVREELQPAAPATAEAYINDLVAGSGFAVESVQHYGTEAERPTELSGDHAP